MSRSSAWLQDHHDKNHRCKAERTPVEGSRKSVTQHPGEHGLLSPTTLGQLTRIRSASPDPAIPPCPDEKGEGKESDRHQNPTLSEPINLAGQVEAAQQDQRDPRPEK